MTLWLDSENRHDDPTLLLQRSRKPRQSQIHCRRGFGSCVLGAPRADVRSALVERLSSDPALRQIPGDYSVRSAPTQSDAAHAGWYLELTLEASDSRILIGLACPSIV